MGAEYKYRSYIYRMLSCSGCIPSVFEELISLAYEQQQEKASFLDTRSTWLADIRWLHSLKICIQLKEKVFYNSGFENWKLGLFDCQIWTWEHFTTKEAYFLFNALNYCDKNYIIPFINNKSEVLLSGNQMYLKWLLPNMLFVIEVQ